MHYLGGITIAVDLHTYLTKHDGKPRPDGSELIRLSRAVKRSGYYLYLAALGHKRLSPELAVRLHEESIEHEITPSDVAKQVSWHLTPDGQWMYRKEDGLSKG